jgi:hypothetical protein
MAENQPESQKMPAIILPAEGLVFFFFFFCGAGGDFFMAFRKLVVPVIHIGT